MQQTTARTPEQVTVQPPQALRLDMITVAQAQGWNCAYCHRRLYNERSIGVHDVPFGGITEAIELWACATACDGPQ